MNWAPFRTDIRSFGRMAGYLIPIGPDTKIVRDLMSAERRPIIGTNFSSMRTMALVAMWRAACWPSSVTLVMGSKITLRLLIATANQILEECNNFDLQNRLMISGDRIRCVASADDNVVYAASGTLGIHIKPSDQPLTVLIPDMDEIPGCHQKYIPKLASRAETTILLNTARRCRI